MIAWRLSLSRESLMLWLTLHVGPLLPLTLRKVLGSLSDWASLRTGCFISSLIERLLLMMGLMLGNCLSKSWLLRSLSEALSWLSRPTLWTSCWCLLVGFDLTKLWLSHLMRTWLTRSSRLLVSLYRPVLRTCGGCSIDLGVWWLILKPWHTRLWHSTLLKIHGTGGVLLMLILER